MRIVWAADTPQVPQYFRTDSKICVIFRVLRATSAMMFLEREHHLTYSNEHNS